MAFQIPMEVNCKIAVLSNCQKEEEEEEDDDDDDDQDDDDNDAIKLLRMIKDLWYLKVK